MYYIEKSDNIFTAKSGNIELDNIKFYDSRENYIGVRGKPVRISVGDFCLEWISNFGYGASNHSAVYVSFKKIFIKAHGSINSTVKFVNLLNYYADKNNIEKENLIVELANLVAYFREAAGVTSRYAYGNDSIYLKPFMEIDNWPVDEVDRIALEKINKMFANKK